MFMTRCQYQQLSLEHLKNNFCNYKLKQFCALSDSCRFSDKALIAVKHISQFLKVVGFLLLVFRCQLEYKVFLKAFSKYCFSYHLNENRFAAPKSKERGWIVKGGQETILFS